MRLDAVLPLTRQDLPRSNLLVRSLEKFFSDLGTVWVVVPNRDADMISLAITDPHYKILPETELIRDLPLYQTLRLARMRRVWGWYVQQVIKLAIASRIESDFYLTLDADVICVRPTNPSDLIKDGRARTKRFPPTIHPEWYTASANLLRMPESHFNHEVTPCLMSKAIVLALQAHITANSLWGGWKGVLLGNTGWTEYALYHTYLENCLGWERYHYEEGDYGLSGNCVWFPKDFPSWSPVPSFTGNSNYFFSVVQSTATHNQDVIDRVLPYLLAPPSDEKRTCEPAANIRRSI